MDKISKMKELNAEYGELLSLKKRLYAEYRQARKEMKDYQTAKYDIDRILNLNTEEQQKENQKKRERVRWSLGHLSFWQVSLFFYFRKSSAGFCAVFGHAAIPSIGMFKGDWGIPQLAEDAWGAPMHC